MYVKRSATLVMSKEKWDILRSARNIIREMLVELDEKERIGISDTNDLEFVDDTLYDIITAGKLENDEVEFEVER